MKDCAKTVAATVAMAVAMTFASFAGTPAEETAKAVALINVYRTEHGLKALVWDDDMSAGTVVRAKEASIIFDHTRPDGSAWYTADYEHFYGENIAEGFTGNAEAVVKAWIASPTHLANIVCDYSTFNLQIYVDENGHWYWANEFNY